MKYNLHYGEVQGEVLGLSHGTNTSLFTERRVHLKQLLFAIFISVL